MNQSGNGVKAYVIGGRHTARVIQKLFGDNPDMYRESIMRNAKVFLCSDVGDTGAQLLGAADNDKANQAVKFYMTFVDKVYLLSTLVSFVVFVVL